MWPVLATAVLHGVLGSAMPAAAPSATLVHAAAAPSPGADIMVCVGPDLVLVKVGGIKIVIGPGTCGPAPVPTPTPAPPSTHAPKPPPTRAPPTHAPPAPRPAPAAVARPVVLPAAPKQPHIIQPKPSQSPPPRHVIAHAWPLPRRRDPFRTVLVIAVISVIVSAGTSAIFRVHF